MSIFFWFLFFSDIFVITIKLPYNSSIEFQSFLKDLRKQQSCVIRYSFNRFKDGYSDTEIRHMIKDGLNNVDMVDAWLIDSSIMESKTIYSSKKDSTIVFGGKHNWKKYNGGKISKEEYKDNRLCSFVCFGSRLNGGNRKFKLDVLNNTIIFKYKCKNHFELSLPKLRDNYKKCLLDLQNRCERNEVPFSIKLNNRFVYISFEPTKIKEEKVIRKRVMSIDMNPNEIGYSIMDFDKNDNFKIIDSGIISSEELNKNKVEASYTKNKRKHEIIEISKFLVEKCVQFKCAKFCLEDLNISNNNHRRGKNFNRLINNRWNRLLFTSNLKKRLKINNVEIVNVNSSYTSFIGNVLHGKKFPDPICSSIEIGRRGFFKFVSDKFYPKLVTFDRLPDQWKKMVNNSYKSWIELFNDIKKNGIEIPFFLEGIER